MLSFEVPDRKPTFQVPNKKSQDSNAKFTNIVATSKLKFIVNKYYYARKTLPGNKCLLTEHYQAIDEQQPNPINKRDIKDLRTVRRFI